MMLLLLVMYLLCVGMATGETTSGTVVQLFEWSHSDVEKECAFLSEKGFEAVQVSPPQESIQGSQWWTRYVYSLTR